MQPKPTPPWAQQYTLTQQPECEPIVTALHSDAGVLLVAWGFCWDARICQYDVFTGKFVRVVNLDDFDARCNMCLSYDGTSVLATNLHNDISEMYLDAKSAHRTISVGVSGYLSMIGCTADAVAVVGSAFDHVVLVYDYASGSIRAKFQLQSEASALCMFRDTFFTLDYYTVANGNRGWRNWCSFSVAASTGKVSETANKSLFLPATFSKSHGKVNHVSAVSDAETDADTPVLLTFKKGALFLARVSTHAPSVQELTKLHGVDVPEPRRFKAELVAWDNPENRRLVCNVGTEIRVFRCLDVRWEWLRAVVCSSMVPLE